MHRTDHPPPHFDATLGAWVVARHRDVNAALRDPRLSAGTAHEAMRSSASRLFSPARVATWRATIEADARRRVPSLGSRVDLVKDYAAPWALDAAVDAVGARREDAERLDAAARALFAASAHARSPDPRDAHAPTTVLARALGATVAPDDVPLAVQAFVALSQTLPALLGGAWLALAERPDQVETLRAEPSLLPRAVDELLRAAGPARAVFRRALDDVDIGGAHVAHGERVVLALHDANHDAARFDEPDNLDVHRGASGHVALGGGAHACLGAPLVRVAIVAATGALLERAARIELAGDVETTGGFAIEGVGSLPVLLR